MGKTILAGQMSNTAQASDLTEDLAVTTTASNIASTTASPISSETSYASESESSTSLTLRDSESAIKLGDAQSGPLLLSL
jgi:hypothetical protein